MECAGEQEVEEALFSFYASALSRFSRFQALLLLAYVTSCGKRAEACALRAEGKTYDEIARALSISTSTAHAYTQAPLPKVPRWVRSALTELALYDEDDVTEQLCVPWRAAC